MAKKPTYEELEQRVKELESEDFDRKQADEESERYRALLSQIDDLAYHCDEEGNVLFLNEAFEKLTNRKIQDFIGKPFAPVFDGTDLKKAIEGYTRTLDGESPQFEVCFKDTGILCEYKNIPLRNKRGDIVGVIGIGRDITQRKKMEEKLQKSKDELEIRVKERTADLSKTNDQLINEMDQRKQAEEYLLKERTLLETIIDNIPVMLTRYNPDANMLYLNKEFEKTVGWKTEEVQDIDMMEKVYPDPDYRHQAMEYMQKASTEWREFRVLSKSGETIDSEWSNVSMEDGTHIGIGMDITERKQAEEALRKSEAFLKTLIDAIPTPVFYKDRDGKYLGFNRAFETFFGETKERLIGKSVFDINPPELAEIYHTQDDELFNSGGVQRYESQWKDVHGKLRDFIFNKAVFTDSKGAVTGLIGVLVDITEHKQAEAALQESEEKYRSMMEAMKDPIYICSQDYRVEYMNPAMIQRTGREATGEVCFKALHDLEEKCPWCMHEKAQQGECSEVDIVSPKDGHSYYISCAPIVYSDGSVSRLTVWKDTTDFRTLETQLQQAQKMEAIGTLAGGIAHDFNNILGGIMGFAELAKMKAPEDSDVFADLEQVLKSSKRAADLVSQILTISRHHKKEQRPVQVRYIVNEALNLLRATLTPHYYRDPGRSGQGRRYC
jgi:PAS domain S-box-containing protein